MTTDDEVTVLLVDDRPANLVALEAILEAPGRRLLKATSGEEALAIALRDSLAVILLDVRMPGWTAWRSRRTSRRSTARATCRSSS